MLKKQNLKLMVEQTGGEFDPLSGGLNDFIEFSVNLTEVNISNNIRFYGLYKQLYSKEFSKVLSGSQVETLLKLRNAGVPASAICNTLKIQVPALSRYLKRLGYRWSISTRSYLSKNLVPRKPKKALVEKTKLYNITLEPAVYRLLVLKGYLEGMTHSQIIMRSIIETSSKELRDLAGKPNADLRFHRLKNIK